MDRLKSRFPHVLQVFHAPEARIERGVRGTTLVSERDPRELGSDFIAYVTKAEASDGEIACFVTGYEAAVRAQALAEAQEREERAGVRARRAQRHTDPLDGAVEVA